METKELKIQVPEGYEIDEKNSTFECIKFKKKVLNYKDILDSYKLYDALLPYTANQHYKKLLAINNLLIVAKYLNDGWTPDFEDLDTYKYYLAIRYHELIIESVITTNISPVYFKTIDLAKQAIEILGEETIKEALSIDY